MIPDQLKDKISQKNIPISASFELTWRCNLKCVHCYQYSPSGDKTELTTDGVKDILDQLQEAGCLYLAFTGGEPLMREDFLEIAEYARSKTFAITLQTNGTLITPSVAYKIHKLSFFNVHISLLGATPKTHDAITKKKGSFQTVMAVVKNLKSEGINVVLKITLMKQNFAEFEQMKRLAEELEVDKVFSPVVYSRYNGDQTPQEFRLDNEDLRKFYSSIFEEDSSQMEPFEGESSPLCRFGRTECCVNPQGKLYPCVAVPIIVGNLKKERFKDIWQNSKGLQKIRKTTFSDLMECSKCELSSLCIRCSGMSFLEEGDLFSPSRECCRITKVIKEVLDEKREKRKV